MTNGRGADAVIEGVGHADALKTGFDLLRPWGVISSFGVHNEEIPWTGNQAYGKNLRIQMGENGREKSKLFSWSIVTDKILDHYLSLTSILNADHFRPVD